MAKIRLSDENLKLIKKVYLTISFYWVHIFQFELILTQPSELNRLNIRHALFCCRKLNVVDVFRNAFYFIFMNKKHIKHFWIFYFLF